jgi:hypothetical protein
VRHRTSCLAWGIRWWQCHSSLLSLSFFYDPWHTSVFTHQFLSEQILLQQERTSSSANKSFYRKNAPVPQWTNSFIAKKRENNTPVAFFLRKFLALLLWERKHRYDYKSIWFRFISREEDVGKLSLWKMSAHFAACDTRDLLTTGLLFLYHRSRNYWIAKNYFCYNETRSFPEQLLVIMLTRDECQSLDTHNWQASPPLQQNRTKKWKTKVPQFAAAKTIFKLQSVDYTNKQASSTTAKNREIYVYIYNNNNNINGRKLPP